MYRRYISTSVMESPTDEEIIQSVMNTSNDDKNDLDPDDSSVLPNVSSKVAFQAITTLNNYLLQHEKNILNVVYALQKVKNELEFVLGAKKKQVTLDANFQKK